MTTCPERFRTESKPHSHQQGRGISIHSILYLKVEKVQHNHIKNWFSRSFFRWVNDAMWILSNAVSDITRMFHIKQARQPCEGYVVSSTMSNSLWEMLMFHSAILSYTATLWNILQKSYFSETSISRHGKSPCICI